MESSPTNGNIDFIFCDFKNVKHCEAVAELINHYISDPMGGGKRLALRDQLHLLQGLADHPSSFVLLARNEGQIIGMATCFINFSTFKVKPYLNIHDIVVKKEFRGQGIGRKLLQKCTDISTERNYCKITLEVRDDNANAKHLYQSLGFKDSEPVMHFWTKVL
jgi:ribosomal protein S18 acetylase RimI-like enzyme